jgi:hypothetical protein
MRIRLAAALCAGVAAFSTTTRATTFVENVTLPLSFSVINHAEGIVTFPAVTFGNGDDIIFNVTFDHPLIVDPHTGGIYTYSIKVVGDDTYPYQIIPNTSGRGFISYQNFQPTSNINGFSVDVTVDTGPFGLNATGSIDTIVFHLEVPEPTTWALMVVGFGAAGALLRRKRRTSRDASRGLQNSY